MTLSKIAACTDIPTLKEALSYADFMVERNGAIQIVYGGNKP